MRTQEAGDEAQSAAVGRRLKPVAWANRVGKDRSLTPTTRARSLDLGTAMRADGTLRTKRDRLAAYLGTSESGVDRLLAALVNAGYLVRTKRGNEGSIPEYVATEPLQSASEVTRSQDGQQGRERVTCRGALEPESASEVTRVREASTARAQRAPRSGLHVADDEATRAPVASAQSATAAPVVAEGLPSSSFEGPRPQRSEDAAGVRGQRPRLYPVQDEDEKALRRLPLGLRDLYVRRARREITEAGQLLTDEAIRRTAAGYTREMRR